MANTDEENAKLCQLGHDITELCRQKKKELGISNSVVMEAQAGALACTAAIVAVQSHTTWAQPDKDKEQKTKDSLIDKAVEELIPEILDVTAKWLVSEMHKKWFQKPENN